MAVQTERVLANLEAILRAAGSGMEKAVRTCVYLKDMNEFAAMNGVYERYFPFAAPARSTVERWPACPRMSRRIDAIALPG